MKDKCDIELYFAYITLLHENKIVLPSKVTFKVTNGTQMTGLFGREWYYTQEVLNLAKAKRNR